MTTVSIVTLQPAPRTDHITEDGTELQQLPYPFHVDPSGAIERQDFWRGIAAAVVGFVADPYRQEVDRYWEEVRDDPQQVVGMYVVTADGEGGMGTWPIAIDTVTVTEVER